MNNIWKFAAVTALAFIPLILFRNEDESLSPQGREVDTDEIFDLELGD
jgi:hypothetical protein